MHGASGANSRRELRGLRILAKGGQVQKISEGIFSVNSESSSKHYKIVWVANKHTCNCPDYLARLKKCKHICAVEWFLKLPEISQSNGFTI